MKINIKERCPLCHQKHAEAEKECGEGSLSLETRDIDIATSESGMSRDADTGAAIVSGHAEEG